MPSEGTEQRKLAAIMFPDMSKPVCAPGNTATKRSKP